jgi:hypothetical protein
MVAGQHNRERATEGHRASAPTRHGWLFIRDGSPPKSQSGKTCKPGRQPIREACTRSGDSRAAVRYDPCAAFRQHPTSIGQHACWWSPRPRPTAQCVRIRTTKVSPSSSLRNDLQSSEFSGTPSVPKSVSCAHRFAGERAVASPGIPELDEAEADTELPSTVIHLAKVRRARRRFIRLSSTARL